MNKVDPWKEIEPNAPHGKLNVRRVDATHPHDLFWGRDANGHRLLIYQAANLPSIKLPSIRGISIELIQESFVLRLTESSDLEIFATLCWSLIDKTRLVQSGEKVLDCLISQLERWQRFLGKGLDRVLSDEQIRGLLCELIFLEQELLTRFGPLSVTYWRGPQSDPQDFAVGTTLFEVKSHIAGSAPIIQISSADQLWHTAGDLFLVIYTIGICSAGAQGSQTLPAVVSRVRKLIHSLDLSDDFENKLVDVGYLDHPEYENKNFVISSPEFYLVRDGFPRISKETIVHGVCRVKYGIELSACLPFNTSLDWTLLGATNGQ